MTVPNKATQKSKARSAAIPAGAKVPSDHRPAKEDVTGPRDVTVTWPVTKDPDVETHDYLIAGESLDDAELLEYFTDQNFVGALRIMLGQDGWASYKENTRNASGRVKASEASEFLQHALAEVKRGNS